MKKVSQLQLVLDELALTHDLTKVINNKPSEPLIDSTAFFPRGSFFEAQYCDQETYVLMVDRITLLLGVYTDDKLNNELVSVDKLSLDAYDYFVDVCKEIATKG